MIKILIILILVEIILFFISKRIRKSFQWFILKQNDLNLKFKKNLIKKFKNNSYNFKLDWKKKKK